MKTDGCFAESFIYGRNPQALVVSIDLICSQIVRFHTMEYILHCTKRGIKKIQKKSMETTPQVANQHKKTVVRSEVLPSHTLSLSFSLSLLPLPDLDHYHFPSPVKQTNG